jgi:lipoprotein-releasing system permease protein
MAERAPGLFSAFERLVAVRYLRARRQEGFISVIAGFSFLGIVLAVATLIITLSVFNGFKTDLLGRVLGFQGHLVLYDRNGPMDPAPAVLERIAALPGIAAVTASVEGPALLSFRDLSAGVAIKALDPADLSRRPLFRDIIRAGTFPGEGAVAIGNRLAQRGGIRLGDRVTLLSPGNQSGNQPGGVPNARSFVVDGLFDMGVSEFDQGIVLMGLSTAQGFLGLGDRLTSVEIFLTDPFQASSQQQAVAMLVPPEQIVSSWQQVNGAFFDIIESQRNVVALILSMIVLVAAFNIISGLIMLVQDKAREVAILRTMGATRGAILRIFLLSGAGIGIAGTLTGVVLGVLLAGEIETIRSTVQSLTGINLFSADIYFLSELPTAIDAGEVVLVALMSISLSFLATLYPSWRAARLDPVEALRYE